jgi:phosphoribosylanthranilate isomerase
MTIIKNCGLRTAESIAVAAKTGASLVGFVHFDASPRHVSLEEGRTLITATPPNIETVAVLVTPDDALLDAVLAVWNPTRVQVHGLRNTFRLQEIKQRINRPLMLGWHVTRAEDIALADSYAGLIDAVLFDTSKPGMHGGTGEAFDWSLLAARKPEIPWFLAGGLNAGNIADALRVTGAPAVDVSSGIESAPGVKSAEKIAAFNRAVLQHNA